MAFESQKKNFCVTGDVYGVIVAAKELEIEKERHFDLGFQVPDVRRALKNVLKTREVREFVSGALAGAMTKAVLAPLETIRTRMVVGVGSRNIAGSFVEVIEQQGWQGLWTGRFETNGSPKLEIGKISIDLSFPWVSPVAVGGAAAGFVSTLACHPLEVLKDRLTVNPEAYPSVPLAISKMYGEGGIGALYSGIGPTLIGMLPYSTCYYFMYETLKNSYCRARKKESMNRADMLLVLQRALLASVRGGKKTPNGGIAAREVSG
ncbi:hypothetical protein Sjap_023043 [Stephania japonica]|uniref:Mitochondrial adenine nucleotide transporter BTL1 n=1 Tax=Stephania japonica TaxID=461633 RepID=A0AAP0HUZ3_9MAGN